MSMYRTKEKILPYSKMMARCNSWRVYGDRVILVKLADPTFDPELVELLEGSLEEEGERLVVALQAGPEAEAQAKVLAAFEAVGGVVVLTREEMVAFEEEVKPESVHA